MGLVTQTHRRRCVRRVHEAIHVILPNVRREAVPNLGRLQIFRRVQANEFLHQRILEKAAERNQVS